jgi:hypothetical protein
VQTRASHDKDDNISLHKFSRPKSEVNGLPWSSRNENKNFAFGVKMSPEMPLALKHILFCGKVKRATAMQKLLWSFSDFSISFFRN